MNSQIGFFPRLYEDELLYSWLARYHFYSPNKSPKISMLDLYNKQSQVAVPDLPANLSVLYNKVADFTNKNLNQLIKDHTFYQYYTMFTSEAHQLKIMEQMKIDSDKSIVHTVTGIAASRVKEKDYFYFCPECFSNDEITIGESYWRLQHQLPGVLVCTRHNCPLQKSTVPFRPHNRHEFVSANSENCSVNLNEVEFTECELDHLLDIAKKIELLFNSLNDGREVDYIGVVKRKLYEKGFLKPSGRVNQRFLSEKFISYYGEELLIQLNSNVDYENSSCWLKAITRKHRKTFHPLRCVLLLNFLENSSVTTPLNHQNVNPFGDGPYPCFNMASSHYNQHVIDKVEVSFCSKTKRPIGLFKCHCGFQYYSNGSEKVNGQFQIRVSRVKEFGHVWKNKLAELINLNEYSFREISRKLGADTSTVIKYSKLLNSKDKNENAIESSLIIEEKRNSWFNLMRKNPDRSVTELRKIKPSLYTYLYRNDKEWLKLNSPQKKVSARRGKSNVNWRERDEFYLVIIEEKIKELLTSEPPTRVTISRIGTELGIRSLLQNKLDKLPNTRALILKKIETIEEFQVRRIKYISNHLLKNDDENISEWKLRKLAGLRNNMGSAVEEIINQITN